MTETMLLPDDVARCYGVPGVSVCHDCLRRLQIEKDNQNAHGLNWYLYMSLLPVRGECEYKIWR